MNGTYISRDIAVTVSPIIWTVLSLHSKNKKSGHSRSFSAGQTYCRLLLGSKLGISKFGVSLLCRKKLFLAVKLHVICVKSAFFLLLRLAKLCQRWPRSTDICLGCSASCTLKIKSRRCHCGEKSDVFYVFYVFHIKISFFPLFQWFKCGHKSFHPWTFDEH